MRAKFIFESLGDVLKPKTPQELKQTTKYRVDNIKAKLKKLKWMHPYDDYGSGTVQDERYRLLKELRQIRTMTETPEQKEKKLSREEKAFQKRVELQQQKEDEKTKRLNALTPKQKAINDAIRLTRFIQDAKRMSRYVNNRESIKNYIKELEDLKTTWGLKSKDLQITQKEYNKTYESVGDVLKPKSEKEINDSIDKIYDELAIYLMEYDEERFDDYLNTLEFIEDRADTVKEYLHDNEKNISEIANILIRGKWRDDDSDFLDDYES